MLIFDFDGIILNSIKEVVVTAYNTTFSTSYTSAEEVALDVTESFLLNRFHFRMAGEAEVLMRWCASEGKQDPRRVLTAAEYTELVNAEFRPVKDRVRKFFATRDVFLETNRGNWLKLNEPYEPLWSALRDAGAERVVILTNKNRAAVIELTHHSKLNILPENVYSGDDGVTKIENLQEIHARFKRPKYLFVDDSIDNLKELDKQFNGRSPISLQLLLGAWGYLGPNDETEARKQGYGVITQSQLIELLLTELPK